MKIIFKIKSENDNNKENDLLTKNDTEKNKNDKNEDKIQDERANEKNKKEDLFSTNENEKKENAKQDKTDMTHKQMTEDQN